MTGLHVELQAPLDQGRAVVSNLRRRDGGAGWVREDAVTATLDLDLVELITARVEAGAGRVIVDLDRIDAPDREGVHRITSLVWSVLAAGAEPLVVCGDRDTADTIGHYKMDRAFAVFGDLGAALSYLENAD